MSELHQLGVSADQSEAFERVSPKFIEEGLLRAQKKTWDVLHEIRTLIKEGMTENDARLLALDVFKDHGVSTHWHKPYIRFGRGTTLTFHNKLQPEYQLEPGDPFYLDLGPVWSDKESGLRYEGDAGETFVFGKNKDAEKCIATAHELFLAAQKNHREKAWTGLEIYRFLKEKALDEGYDLVDEVAGHRVGDFPHQKYSKARLSELGFFPSDKIWVLELQINDPQKRFGAFFEDLL